MDENERTGGDLLSHLCDLGTGSGFAPRIFDLVGHSPFFEEFDRPDVDVLAGYMRVHAAQPGQTLLAEGDGGDFMLLIIEGNVDIYKANARGDRQLMTGVGPGATIGEMSMIDGEPRFATCIATEPTTFAVLTREGMAGIIVEKPELGAKILIKLVTLLSARLRQTSARLLQYMAG
jgi:CRP/FNR family cyclic AMP-dependent transcriptional regulator